MKLTILILNVLILLISRSHAQAPVIQWQKCLGGEGNDNANAIQKTFDGGYVIAGEAGSYFGDLTGADFRGGGDFWLLKIDSVANIEWQRSFGGFLQDQAWAVIQTTDSGYVFVGNTGSDNIDVTGYIGLSPEHDIWIIRADKIGDLQWEKCFGGTQNDRTKSVIQTSDGGFVFAGYTYSNDSDVSGNHSPNNSDAWVVKFDGNGDIIWQKCFGGTDNEGASSIIECEDGNLAFLGNTYSSDGDVSFNHGTNSPDYWLVMLDPLGNLLWEKTFGGSSYDIGVSLQQTDNQGGLILGGYSFSTDGDVTNPLGNYDYWLVRTDNGGNLLWQKSYGGTNQDWGRSVIVTQDQGFAFSGMTDSNDGDVTGLHTTLDYWLVKTDSSGTLEWQKCMGGSGMDNIYDPYSVVEANAGEYLIAGFTSSTDGDVTGLHSATSFDAWLVKLAPLGADVSSPVVSIEKFNAQLTDGNLQISFTAEKNVDATIILYDVTGRAVLSKSLSLQAGFNTNNITTGELNAGIYSVRMIGSEIDVFKKLAVQ